MEGTPGTPEPNTFYFEDAPKLCREQVTGSCPQWQSKCRDEHAEDPAAAYVEWVSKKTLNLCRFFAKGRCAKGAACTYLHVKTCPSDKRNLYGVPTKPAIKTQAEIDTKSSKDRIKPKEALTARTSGDSRQGLPGRPGQDKAVFTRTSELPVASPSEPQASRSKTRASSSKTLIAQDPLLRAVKQTRGKVRALLSVQQSLDDIAKHVGGDIQTKSEHTNAIVEEVRARLAAFNQWIDEQTQSIGFKAAPDEGINDASDDSA